MNRFLRAPLPLLLALAACRQGSPADPGDPTPLELGRTYTGWFYEVRVDPLWDRLSPELREGLGGPEGLRAFGEQVRAELGAEAEVREERVIPWLGASIYHRTSTFSGTAAPIWVQWTIEPAGGVLAFLVAPGQEPAPSDHLEYTTRTPLRLPFSGAWFVYWGGRSVPENYHAASPDQRFAYDLLVVRDGRTYAGDPARNESYHCFDLPVLAPAAGVVAVAEDGIADNAPGEMNEAQVPGNHVVLDHGNGEYSFLAHLRRGSVAVAVGERVEAGAEVGRCGNSGRSSEAHLHYHLQTTPEFGAGEGLPAQFLDYVADGEAVARGEPTRGQHVSPGPAGGR